MRVPLSSRDFFISPVSSSSQRFPLSLGEVLHRKFLLSNFGRFRSAEGLDEVLPGDTPSSANPLPAGKGDTANGSPPHPPYIAGARGRCAP